LKNKILVVDDEVDLLNVAKIFLESKGYEVITATNGDEALEKVASEKPDAIILDLLMPKKDGFEVCTTLKTTAATSQIPIIVSSVLAREEDRAKALKIGADAYLTKPYNFEIAAAIIKDILEAHKNV
jgi:DNA-binding response OmpR family regulator